MKSLTSTNFWFSVISLFTIALSVLGINIDPSKLEAVVVAVESKQLTAIVLGVVVAIMLLYNTFKANKVTGNIGDVFKSRNFWTGLITVAAAAFSWFSTEGFPVELAEQLVDAVKTGNIVLIITAAWTFGQSVWYIFVKKDEVLDTQL